MKKLILFVFLLPLLFSCEQEKPQPPNIVFIMSDDHAFQAVSAYGHGLNNTPNIDRIARGFRAYEQRGRDSNPRYAFGVYTLSRRAPSTARPPL